MASFLRPTFLLVLLTAMLNFGLGMFCDCEPTDIRTVLEDGDRAFSGKAFSVHYVDPSEQLSPEPRIVVTFEVYELWNGKSQHHYVLHTVYNKWTCDGYPFEVDKEYLVFPTPNPEHIAELFKDFGVTEGVSTCTATTTLIAAQDVLDQLSSQ